MGLFDSQENRKKLIIVHSANTTVFANYLQMLISAKDDNGDEIIGIKDGTVETTIWTEKEYIAQKPTLSSVDHVLFIGMGKIIAEETYGMKDEFNMFGMKYGWLGKRAYLKVMKNTPKKKEIQDYFKFASCYDAEVNAHNVLKDKKFDKFGRVGAEKTIENVVRVVISPVEAAFVYNEAKDRIRSSQYRTVTTIFYREGLAKFMNA